MKTRALSVVSNTPLTAARFLRAGWRAAGRAQVRSPSKKFLRRLISAENGWMGAIDPFWPVRTRGFPSFLSPSRLNPSLMISKGEV